MEQNARIEIDLRQSGQSASNALLSLLRGAQRAEVPFMAGPLAVLVERAPDACFKLTCVDRGARPQRVRRHALVRPVALAESVLRCGADVLELCRTDCAQRSS